MRRALLLVPAASLLMGVHALAGAPAPASGPLVAADGHGLMPQYASLADATRLARRTAADDRADTLSHWGTTSQRETPEGRLVAKLRTADAVFWTGGYVADRVVTSQLPTTAACAVTHCFTWKLTLATAPTRFRLGLDTPSRESSFTVDKVAYFAVASRSSGAADDFHMEWPLRGKSAPLTGSFDLKRNEVLVNVPADFFSKNGTGPALRNGAKLTGFAITTRRNEANAIVPNTDEAGSLGCPFVVGAQSVAVGGPLGPVGSGTVPSPVDRRPVPGLAATGLPVGVPVLALGLVLTAGLLVRRRIS